MREIWNRVIKKIWSIIPTTLTVTCYILHIINLSHLCVHIHYCGGKPELLVFLLTQIWYCWILSPILLVPLNSCGKNISYSQHLWMIESASSHSPFEAWSENSKICHDDVHASLPSRQPLEVKCSCASKLNEHWSHWIDKQSIKQ